MIHPIAADACPTRFPSPFGPPHPIAWRAAQELMARLPPLDDGKMFGVLVIARPDGTLGALHAVSGMPGAAPVPGMVGSVFDPAEQDRFWSAGQAELAERSAAIADLDAQLADVEARITALEAGWRTTRADLRARHARRQAARHLQRAATGPSAALDQASRADKAEARRALAEHDGLRAPLLEAQRTLRARRRPLVEARQARSQALQRALHQTYRFTSVAGEQRALIELFAPDAPPAGAGDCAGPKLLAHATRQGLRPIALAEFWWGPPPPGGGRWHGQAYPACRGKCGVILPFQLQGLAVEPPPTFEAAEPAAPTILYEDAWILAVDKPAGLLSVPGRGARPTVLSRLGRDDLRPVHRLDLDTSGVLVLAKTEAICIAMQQRFAQRAVQKRYIAVLDGVVPGAEGTIDLALRPDITDRPRQIHDPTGKPAHTRWTRIDAHRVALYPTTGRTHQLRVHCAHPSGLGVPIVGDRLYGRAGERLMLHAERIEFEHPADGRWIRIERAAAF